MANTQYVTASEIGDFVYCKRAWWLRFNNLLPAHTEQMIKGASAHNALAQELHTHSQRLFFALALITVSVVGLMIIFFISLFTH